MSQYIGFWIIGHYSGGDEVVESEISDEDAAVNYAKECSKADEVYVSVIKKDYYKEPVCIDDEHDEVYGGEINIVDEELVWSNTKGGLK